MDIGSEINWLISEFRTTRKRSKEQILSFLDERKLTVEKVIQFFIKLQDDHFEEYHLAIHSWITDNLQRLIETACFEFIDHRTFFLRAYSGRKSES